MPSVLVVCPSPTCPGRSVQESVESGYEVLREEWEATWRESRTHPEISMAGEWWADIACPRCGTEGIDPESGQLDSAEEELGMRCSTCGVVSATKDWAAAEDQCPHCWPQWAIA